MPPTNPYDQFDSSDPYAQFEEPSKRRTPKELKAFTPADQDRLTAIAKKSRGEGISPKESEEFFDLMKRRDTGTDPVAKGMAGMFTGENPLIKRGENIPYEFGGKITDITGSPGLGTAAYTTLNAIPMIAGGVMGGEASAAAVRPVADWLKHELMFSALKPSSIGADLAKQEERVRTMLEGGYNVTRSGVEKMHGKISDLEGEIRTILSKSPEKTTLADISAQAGKSREQFVLEKDQKTVDRVFDEIKKKYFPRGELSMEDAHALKQRIYQNVKDKSYASGELQSAEKEGMMGAARGIRESEIRAGVGPQLAQQQKLLDVLEPAEKRAIVELRNNPIGISMLAHNPRLMALYIGDRSSAFKSAVANLLHQRAEPFARGFGQLGGTGGVSLYELSNAGSSSNGF